MVTNATLAGSAKGQPHQIANRNRMVARVGGSQSGVNPEASAISVWLGRSP